MKNLLKNFLKNFLNLFQKSSPNEIFKRHVDVLAISIYEFAGANNIKRQLNILTGIFDTATSLLEVSARINLQVRERVIVETLSKLIIELSEKGIKHLREQKTNPLFLTKPQNGFSAMNTEKYLFDFDGLMSSITKAVNELRKISNKLNSIEI
jgi:hypothetical protein